MSTLIYNNITLPYIFHTNFSQEAVYEDSHTDRILTKFDITVQAILNTNYLSRMGNNANLLPAGTPPAGIMNAIRSQLLQQRKVLSVQINGVELIPQSPTGVSLDAMNGPQPQYCNIMMLTATTFLITYRIVANYVENNQIIQNSPYVKNQKGDNVLYNRWTETDSYDSCLFCTRVREGKFMIRSDNASKQVADQFRTTMAVVGVPNGFLRKSSSYTIAPNGLAISYRTEDKEYFKVPPQPAYEAEGDYMENTMNGAKRFATVRLRLKGSKVTSQAELIDVAMGICGAKLALAGAQAAKVKGGGGKFGLLQQCQIRTGMYENWIEVVMTAMMKPRSAQVGGNNGKGKKDDVWGMDFSDTIVTPGSEANVPPPKYPPYGTVPSLLLQAAAYYDPTVPGHKLATNGQITNGAGIGSALAQQS